MNRLRELRLSRGLKLKDMATIVNKSLQAYGMYERGERNIDNEVLISLADFFNVTTDYLLGREALPIDNEQFTLTSEAKLHIKKYLQLDIEGRAAVDNVLDFEFSKISRKERAIQNAVI